MRKGFLGSITVGLVVSGLASAQTLTPEQLSRLPTTLPLKPPEVVKPVQPAPAAPPSLSRWQHEHEAEKPDANHEPPPPLPTVETGLFTEPSSITQPGNPKSISDWLSKAGSTPAKATTPKASPSPRAPAVGNSQTTTPAQPAPSSIPAALRWHPLIQLTGHSTTSGPDSEKPEVDRPPPPPLPLAGSSLFADPTVKPPPRPVKAVAPPKPQPVKSEGDQIPLKKIFTGDSKPVAPELVPTPPVHEPPPPLPMEGTPLLWAPSQAPTPPKPPPPKPIKPVSAVVEAPKKPLFPEEPPEPPPPMPKINGMILQPFQGPRGIVDPTKINYDDDEICPMRPGDVNYHDGHFWMSGEYLYWTVPGGPTIPLLTTGPAATQGILGAPGVSVLFPGSHFDLGAVSGIRASMGFCDPHETCGIEGTGFYLLKQQSRFTASSDANGNPTIARPLIDAVTGAETVQFIALPGAFAGTVTIDTSSELWGSEFNLLGIAIGSKKLSVDLLLGFRYLSLTETFREFQSSDLLANGLSALNGVPIITPNNVTISEFFDTRTQFFGGQIGLQAEYRFDSFFVDFASKIALGTSHELANIGGTTSVTPPGGPTTTVPGGILAVATNSGQNHHDEFAVVPEVQLALGYKLHKNIRVYLGYNMMYWSDVARPGDVLDRTVNRTQIPTSLQFGPLVGPARPSPAIHQSDVFIHGGYAGVAFRY